MCIQTREKVVGDSDIKLVCTCIPPLTAMEFCQCNTESGKA